MELKLRQRVIGGVVLAALAVIFLPLLFKSSGPKHKQVTMQASIPQSPAKPSSQDVMTMQGSELNQQGAQQAVDSRTATSMAPISQMTEVEAPAPNAKPVAQNNPQPTNIQETPNQLAFGNKPLTQKPAATTSTTDASAQTQAAKQTNLASNNPKQSAADNEVILTSPIESDKGLVDDQSQHQHANNKPAVVKAAHTTKHAPATHKAATSKKAASAANKLPPASAWVVQLGSFGDTQRAKLLVKQLRAQGYKAYTRQTKTSKGTAMTRVFVGPEAKRAKAEALQAKLNKDVKTKGVVVAYSPIQAK